MTPFIKPDSGVTERNRSGVRLSGPPRARLTVRLLIGRMWRSKTKVPEGKMRRAALKGPLAGLLLAFGVSSGAIAADVKTLSSILYPSYLAMNLAIVCASEDHTFLSATGGPRGSALAYAQHIKDEVIDDLGASDAEHVVREAAGSARSVALKLVRHLGGDSEAIGAQRVRVWCNGTAKPFIQSVIAAHETNHDLFEQMVEAAK